MSRRAGKDNSKSRKKYKQTTSSVCHEAPAPATTKDGEPSHSATAGIELSEGFLAVRAF